MPVTLKNALVLDPRSKFFKKRVDIFLDKGKIKKIGKGLKTKGKAIEEKSLTVSPGWIDLNVRINDPGYEFKETLADTLSSALAGGFTRIATLPFTKPVIQTKDLVSSLIEKGKSYGVNIHPIAALSEDFKEERLNDLQDLTRAGAVGFTDGLKSRNSEITSNGLRYLSHEEGIIFSRAMDPELSQGAQVHEGIMSTKMGLKGFSIEAETLRVSRDLDLLRMNGGRLHFSKVSTPDALKLIKKAKSEGLKVSCDVPAYLFGNDESLVSGYNTRYKLDPPLRSKTIISSLLRFIGDGTIDAISSGHSPQDPESRDLEFDLASFGGRTLEGSFPSFWSAASEKIQKESIPELFSLGPAKALGLNIPLIEEDQEAEITVFQLDQKWSYQGKENGVFDDPFSGSTFSSRVLGTISMNRINL